MSNQQITCSIPHGVVFLYDPQMIVDVPEDTGSETILYTDNCISVWTLHEDDGKVQLSISDEEMTDTGDLRFTGYIINKSGRVSFNDSGVNEIIGIDVPTGKVSIRVYSNDPKYPTKVACLVG